MLLGWGLSALFFLGALGVWALQILRWLQTGSWQPVTLRIVFDDASQIQWQGAAQLLSFIYDINVGLVLVPLAVISAELGLFLDSQVAQRIGATLKSALLWPYLIGASALLALVILAVFVAVLGQVTEFDWQALPKSATLAVFVALAAAIFFILRNPLADRLR